MDMANNGNLRPPWQKGQSGNPAGRKKGYRPAAAVLRELIAKHGLDETIAEVWVAGAIGDPKLLKGRKPSIEFLKLLVDRIDGPVPRPAPPPEPSLIDLVKQFESGSG
jgi:hypothetical protein